MTPSRRARGTGAILLLGLALFMACPAARAEVPEVGEARRCLQQAAAALEEEADRLESLATDQQLRGPMGMIALAGYLADAELRVWELQVEVDGVEQWAALDDRAAYGEARGRMTGLLDDLWAEARTSAESVDGLPAPGRICPVEGLVGFNHTWGEQRPWGRIHKGEDLHAEAGIPLIALESGTILQAGWHWQGGFGVWLAGYYSGDVYYYAHLSWIPPEIEPGETVEVGELVGWVGCTGNATSPHLHFGWIPGDTGEWPDLGGLADPYPLLVGLCG